MSNLSKPLSAAAADEYINHIVARLTAGDDAAALEASLRSFDSDAAGEAVKLRLAQVFQALQETRQLSNGQVVPTITTAGTGYAVGDVLPVTGDGQGATVTVSAINEGDGAITELEFTAGVEYTTASVDATGEGDGLAVIDVTIHNDLDAVLTAAAAVASA